MPKVKTRNPANKTKTSEVIRFKGIINADNEQMVDRAYVEHSDNLVSFRLREMNARSGQSIKDDFTHGINAGEKTLSQMAVISGPNLFVDPIRDNLTPTEDINFMRPIVVPSFGSNSLSGTVILNTTNVGIVGAKITIRTSEGGDIIATTYSGTDGVFAITGLDKRYYYVEATKSAHEDYGQVLETGGSSRIVMSAELASGTGAVTLLWNAVPEDLDLHLTGPNPSTGRWHCYFDDKVITDEATLDIDDTTSYGPETATIHRFNSGVYRISVHNYSDRGSTSNSVLSSSGATLNLFLSGGVSKTFFVPVGAGTLWTAVEIDGDTLEITTVGGMSYHEDPDTIT